MCFAADPGVRFGMTSFLGLMLDICMMQPGRVFVVAIVRVIKLSNSLFKRDLLLFVSLFKVRVG
jgi:hypothetical protein